MKKVKSKSTTKNPPSARTWRSGDRDLQITKPLAVTLELPHDYGVQLRAALVAGGPVAAKECCEIRVDAFARIHLTELQRQSLIEVLPLPRKGRA